MTPREEFIYLANRYLRLHWSIGDTGGCSARKGRIKIVAGSYFREELTVYYLRSTAMEYDVVFQDGEFCCEYWYQILEELRNALVLERLSDI